MAKSRIGPVLLGLALTGAAGLIDEVVWSRALATLFGAALPATGLLLAIFMAGLGAGSAWGGRRAATAARPLAWFGAVEVAIGFLVLPSPWLLRSALPLVVSWDVRLPDAWAALVPAIVTIVVLGPIVFLMGATFPLLLAQIANERDGVGSASAVVYGVNTLGAVAGTLLAGFWLLPRFGIERSLWLAAATDIGVGAACLLASRRAAIPTERRSSIVNATIAPAPERAAGIALVAGFAALTLEVAWFRALALILGSSVYALTIMLAAFLIGIAGGSLVVRRHAAAPGPALAQVHALVALASTMTTILLQALPLGYIALLEVGHGEFAPVALGSFALAGLVLIAPTALMGAALPLAIRLGTGASAAGDRRDAGRIYAASSLGSSLGALLAGFVLVPWLGLRGSVAIAVGASLAAGWMASASGRRGFFQVAGVTAVVWAIWWGGLLPWDWRVLTAGYYAYGHLYSGNRAAAPGPVRRAVTLTDDVRFADRPSLPAESADDAPAELLSWEEGRYAQVAVVEQSGTRSLLINGKADASNGPGDMRTQLLLGHLPALLAPDAAAGDALVIGLGSGVTAGAVATWPYRRITVAEIEAAVARATRWFEAENGRVLADPRVELRIDDARRVLARDSAPLALLTSEPSNLWMSGVSLLFTREFFELAAARLGERGVFCQWLHLYQVDPDDVRTLLASIHGPFPHLVAFADGTDLLVLASRSPLVLDPDVWRARIASAPAVAPTLAHAGIASAADLAAGILADERALGRWSNGAQLHTDDLPILEFTAARAMGRDRSGPILAALVAAGEAAGPIRLGKVGRIGR